ncbi:hypothetical protein BN000_04104 [Neobacillus massiliamazoniensis]|uniref:Uncharacterized protein n=1 Tax=Neobacillus massiliamazoniensis TaxID=1499688 RepID=A0A0U1P1C8_9BACI|nr:hypothetical protein BN000_04104 [Neobacillus massiliamazoniensis]
MIFETMLIGAEGARLLREYGAGETPQAHKRRGGSPERPRKAKRLERKSTGKFNTAYFLMICTNQLQPSFYYYFEIVSVKKL